MLESHMTQSVSPEEAIRLTRKIYGLEVQAQSLPGEYDHNFHLTTSDGQAFVLKVMHPDRERSIVELQSQALQHLTRRAPHLVLPRVQLTRNGEPFTKVLLQGREEHFVWMLNFLDGKVLARVRPHTTELFQNLGRL